MQQKIPPTHLLCFFCDQITCVSLSYRMCNPYDRAQLARFFLVANVNIFVYKGKRTATISATLKEYTVYLTERKKRGKEDFKILKSLFSKKGYVPVNISLKSNKRNHFPHFSILVLSKPKPFCMIFILFCLRKLFLF